MMIALRNALLGNKRLPYDAEVEYLEADNVGLEIQQPVRGVIDTGIVPNLDTDVWECDAQFVQFGTTAGCWGCTENRFAFGRGSVSWSDWYFGLGNTNNRTGNAYDNQRHIFRLDGPNRRLTIDSTTYNGSGVIVSGYNLTAAIFNRNTTSGITYRADNARSRCYSAKFYRNGVLIQDLIPVRIGAEGAMYDKVSKRLFLNQGTGSFVCGRDINPISARSYIKDGLIAMWDGIENAGWGMHDANATVWKDLIGDCDAVTSTALVFADYMYENNTTAERKLTVASKIDFSAMNYLTLESCFSNMTDSQAYHMVIGANTDYFSVGWPAKDGTYLSWKLGNGQRPTVTAGRSGTIAAVYDNGQASLWYNGAMGDRYSSAKNWASNMYLAWGNCWGLARGTKRCHCYRLYNRALTADEIAINYAIDKARFGLG